MTAAGRRWSLSVALAVGATTLGCATSSDDASIAAAIKQHYAAYATEEEGTCRTPRIDTIQERRPLESSPDGGEVVMVRYSYFDSHADMDAHYDKLVHLSQPCGGIEERRFVLARDDLGYRVTGHERRAPRRGGCPLIMAEDLYSVLGVSREASQEEIKRRYRKLAKELHPDLNPGDEAVADRFKRVSAAHAILSDPKKRASYDLGEIDDSGQARQHHSYHHDFAGGGQGAGFDESVLEGLFAEMFGRGRRPGFRPAERGEDAAYSLTIDFLEAAKGAKKRVAMGDGKTLDITIPAGIQEGQTLRLRGKGRPGIRGGPAGDAMVEIRIKPHPLFERKGQDIHIDLPVTLGEAVLGARIDVPTIDGPVTMTVPKGSSTGTTLRLKERGIAGPKGGARGNQYVRLSVTLPPSSDDDLEAFLERWSEEHPYDPRTALRDL